MTCSLCKNKAAPDGEGLDFECGNGANDTAYVDLCQNHLDELEKDEQKFRDKYEEKFERIVLEERIDHADVLRDAQEGK